MSDSQLLSSVISFLRANELWALLGVLLYEQLLALDHVGIHPALPEAAGGGAPQAVSSSQNQSPESSSGEGQGRTTTRKIGTHV